MNTGEIPTSIVTDLKAEAQRLGFSMVGIVDAAPAKRLDAYKRWLAAEMHGAMGYLARPDRQARREDLNVILPGVQSLVVVGLDYYTVEPPAELVNDPSRGRISNYAWQQDYHDIMTPKLHELGQWLAQAVGTEVADKVYVDTGAILERDHAESAGLGFIGKNTMLIGPQRGSWFFLGELLTTVPLPPDPMPQQPGCGSCTRCLTACPTAAFPSPYVLDARRCISYLTIELKGSIPRELRPMMGNWIYGCDVCQVVCPFNRFAPRSMEVGFEPAGWDTIAPPLADLLRLDDEQFKQRFAHSPIKRIKRRRLVRNAAVAAGNSGDAALVPPLIDCLLDTEPLIRGHAAWALGQFGTVVTTSALHTALTQESNPDVQQEIKAALRL